ncbi:MAG: class I SAM-dependent methyltransferase [Chloroflexi bacterium]|nr:class I SAM-dependent methyltransferase [Chloroflexota bacterium]
MIKRLLRRFQPALSTLSSLDAYARWAVSYPPQAHNPLMQAEQAAMLDLLPPVAGAVVLDLAGGTGRYGLLARERGARLVIELDNSAAMLARNPLPCRALATAEALPLPDASLDGIVCALALGHLPRLMPALAEISRVLKSGGWALISDFHPLLYLSGGRRTFTTPDGQTYAVEHYPHLYSDYHQAARQANLVIDDVAEPRRTPPSQRHHLPVVMVFRLVKPASR